ncbi:MAG: hypothetical protein SOY73_07815, partial [Blautia sp.]|nr:TnpV protein [Blautia sp.]MDY3998976.1 hypothetical protein [Blautia sp.]
IHLITSSSIIKDWGINKKKSKLFFYTMPYLSAYLHESLDFFKVGILRRMNNIRNRAEEIILHELVYEESAR